MCTPSASARADHTHNTHTNKRQYDLQHTLLLTSLCPPLITLHLFTLFTLFRTWGNGHKRKMAVWTTPTGANWSS